MGGSQGTRIQFYGNRLAVACHNWIFLFLSPVLSATASIGFPYRRLFEPVATATRVIGVDKETSREATCGQNCNLDRYHAGCLLYFCRWIFALSGEPFIKVELIRRFTSGIKLSEMSLFPYCVVVSIIFPVVSTLEYFVRTFDFLHFHKQSVLYILIGQAGI